MGKKKLQFFIVDDDKEIIELYTTLLEGAGHLVTGTTISTQALERMIDLQPDCVLCDLSLPDLDGLDLFQLVRKEPKIKKQPIFIIITSKQYEYDLRRALRLGVNGYLTKPVNVETFVNEVLEIIADKMIVQFWGVRGTLPVPGKKTVRYGGNTNCVTLSFGKKNFFIFDAGTGIKALSNYLLEKNKFPFSAKIFISHPHWDHINGIPFFVPLYMKGNEFEIYGSSHPGISIEKLISNQMDSVYFPVSIKEFAAKITFHNLNEENFYIDDILIQTQLLNHPGRCLGYRVQYKNKSFCYITDNELYLEESPYYNEFDVERLIHFIYNTNILIMDTTYTDEIYPNKICWGHSCVSRVVDIAHKAKVKLLCLYHHDPDQFDSDIDLKLKQAKALLKSFSSKTQCIAPHEGDLISI